MLSFYRRYGRTVFDLFLVALTVYLIMYVFSYVYQIAKPIFIAFIIFVMIEPLAKFLHRKGLKKLTGTTISTLVFILLISGIVITLGVIFTSQIYHLSQVIPEYVMLLQKEMICKVDYVQNHLEAFPIETVDKIKGYLMTISEKSSKLLSGLLLLIFNSLTSISSFIINFVIALILAFFLSVEIEQWKHLAQEKTPKTFKTAFFFLKDNVLKGILLYIKAQLKLISFTFIFVFVGLLLLGINNAFSISLLAAFFDILPLLGVSTIFVPWIIYLFVIGEVSLGIWLSVLLAFVIVFRQIAEPKITGDSLGVSAFTMLSFMVISLSLFGVAGIILSPILLILIKALYDQGYLKQWIHLPEDEYDLKT